MPQLIGGPLDGYDASLSELSGGRAIFGLVRRRAGYSTKQGQEDVYWDADAPSHKQAQHAEYVNRNGRWIWTGTRT